MSVRNATNHGRRHGPDFFPWVCRVCPLSEKAFVISDESMIRHWHRDHPDMFYAEEVVHPLYGNHYSYLQKANIQI